MATTAQVQLFIYIILSTQFFSGIYGIFEFPKEFENEISPEDLKQLSQITEAQLIEATQLGVQSINSRQRLESNLLQAHIFVMNGTISHAQLLENFPSDAAKEDDQVAKQILKSSLYVLHSQCSKLDVNCHTCAKYLSNISLPASELKEKCLSLMKNSREGHHAYRRLLPGNYKDGLYKMLEFPEVPKARIASKLGENAFGASQSSTVIQDESRNLVFLQWAQFIEHDLSKPVVTTMSDGTPIECCSEDFYKLTPRYVHPACAPLEGVASNRYGKVPCLNYVRSALAVNPECKFGPAQQLNQASSSLDLSQLYGYTKEERAKMRTFENGELKASSHKFDKMLIFLPAAENKEDFCAFSENSRKICLMAGDNRVNSNPFMNIIYTIFLRSHNQMVKKLKKIHPSWDDEQLYTEARRININVYRNIVYNEWLPSLLGQKIAKAINSEDIKESSYKYDEGVSNEFAVAAIRFYYSMMPDALLRSPVLYQSLIQENVIDASSSVSHKEQVFALKDEFYKSDFISHPYRLSFALEAMLEQKAMKMDSHYEDCITKFFLQTNLSTEGIHGMDGVAWDIQRSRDHGLAGYKKYLEICNKTKINDWDDLRRYIKEEDITKLKNLYNTVEDIDLIMGGVSEIPSGDSLLGPTFTCIIGEQFSNTRRFDILNSGKAFDESIPINYKAHQLLCETTNLADLPQNIFFVPSERNTLVTCSDR